MSSTPASPSPTQAPLLRLVSLQGPVRGGQLAPALALALAHGGPLPVPMAAGPGEAQRPAFRVVSRRAKAYELEVACRALQAAGKDPRSICGGP